MSNDITPKPINVRLSVAEMNKWNGAHYFYVGQSLGETALAPDTQIESTCAEVATLIMSLELAKREDDKTVSTNGNLTTPDKHSKLNGGF